MGVVVVVVVVVLKLKTYNSKFSSQKSVT